MASLPEPSNAFSPCQSRCAYIERSKRLNIRTLCKVVDVLCMYTIWFLSYTVYDSTRALKRGGESLRGNGKGIVRGPGIDS